MNFKRDGRCRISGTFSDDDDDYDDDPCGCGECWSRIEVEQHEEVNISSSSMGKKHRRPLLPSIGKESQFIEMMAPAEGGPAAKP